MNTPFIVPGIDLTVLTCITAADVMQAISAAYVESNIGGIIHSNSAPDVVTYPDAKRFLWDKTIAGVSYGDLWYWDGSAWTELLVFDGTDIIDHSIPYDKFELADPYEILQMNAAGTEWGAISIPNAIQANTIPVTKLVKPVSGSGQVLYYDGANITFANLGTTWIVANIADHGLPIVKLAFGAARAVLRTNAAGNNTEYAAPGSLFEPYEIPVISLATDTLSLTATAGVVTLDAEDGGPAWYFSITANVTDFNVTNLQDGREITVLIQQDGVGSRTLVWDAAIIWPTATAPTIASAASAKTLVTFKAVNGAIYGDLAYVAATGAPADDLFTVRLAGDVAGSGATTTGPFVGVAAAFDTANGWDDATYTYTTQAAGKFRVSAVILYTSSSAVAGNATVQISKNGTPVLVRDLIPFVSTSESIISLEYLDNASAGDDYQLEVIGDTGGKSFIAQTMSSFSVVKL